MAGRRECAVSSVSPQAKPWRMAEFIFAAQVKYLRVDPKGRRNPKKVHDWAKRY